MYCTFFKGNKITLITQKIITQDPNKNRSNKKDKHKKIMYTALCKGNSHLIF